MDFSNRVRTIYFAFSLARKDFLDSSELGRIKIWRRGRDLNSRYLLSTHDFQSCSFGRSDTSPRERCI